MSVIKNERISGGRMRMPVSTIVFHAISFVFITLIAITCLLPFVLIISGSFTAEQSIRVSGYSLVPKEFATEAYSIIFRSPTKVLNAYGVSIFVTGVGTVASLFFTTMTAYVLSRKDFKYRGQIAFLFYFTTLFNGGMISTYIFFIQYLHLKDNLLALILPAMVNVFYLLIMRSFVSSIPVALIESAKIDGAGEFRTFIQIVFPLLKSGLATVGLLIALGYWNDWYNAMLYINTESKYPLQYMLYDLQMRTQALARVASQVGIKASNLPSNSLKMAMAVVATGPIIFLYPFVQKYFVKGITIGSVKG